ncbi:MAG: IPT/TIG domain-containing protein, partial [Kangiellaceae bacterium]|nr:IPT/TIG domain-containing protein [Kangiellaceae bacterium]
FAYNPALVLNITSVTTTPTSNYASPYFDTYFEIAGNGFSTTLEDNSVKVGAEDCLMTQATATLLKCTLLGGKAGL